MSNNIYKYQKQDKVNNNLNSKNNNPVTYQRILKSNNNVNYNLPGTVKINIEDRSG